MKGLCYLRVLILLAVIGLASCGPVSPLAKPVATPTLPAGHWEVVRRISYYDLPKASLKGDIGPAYLSYPVTLTGFHTEMYGITIGPDDDVRYTTDGGQTWTKAASALFCRFGLDIVDEKVAWHCGNGGTRVSTDGGQTWKTVAPSTCPYLSFLDAQTGWAASPYDLQGTTDGGAAWKKVALPPGAQEVVAVALRTASDGYVLDKTGTLFVTADGGKSWEKRFLGVKDGAHLLAGAMGQFVAMRFLDAQHGIVVFDLADSDRTVWFAQTQDGGRSWQQTEISELRNQSYYYHLYLSRDGRWLTATDKFNAGTSATVGSGSNVSVVLRYRQP